MQLRTWVIVASLGAGALWWSRSGGKAAVDEPAPPAREARELVAVARTVARAPVRPRLEVETVVADLDAEIEADEPHDPDLDHAAQAAAATRPHTGTVYGHVMLDGDRMPEAVVVARGADDTETTVVADDDGRYMVTGLSPGPVTLTYYANDLAVETRVDVTADTTHRVHQDLTQPPDEYVVNIPTGRTFEAALGAAVDTQGDELSISFSGVTSLENEYIIE